MTHLQSREMYWLALTILLTATIWIPYILNRLFESGLLKALWDPHGDTHTNRAWAQRMMQAHQNAVENLVVFAPLVLMVQISGLNSTSTATACMVYFFARLTHLIVFTFAVPVIRILAFLTGFIAQLVLLAVLLGL